MSVLAAFLAAAACLPGAGTGAVGRDTTGTTAYLTGASVAVAGCADRVVFRFERNVPSYTVSYRSAAIAQVEDASGKYIPIAGRAYLVVRFRDALTARSDKSGALTKTYAGKTRIEAIGTHHVRELVKTGDFEAVVTWAIGVDGKRAFTVSSSGDSLAVEIG